MKLYINNNFLSENILLFSERIYFQDNKKIIERIITLDDDVRLLEILNSFLEENSIQNIYYLKENQKFSFKNLKNISNINFYQESEDINYIQIFFIEEEELL